MDNLPRPLTAKEKKVLSFIEQYVDENQMAPSFREIRDFFCFASFNSVQNYIKQLQKKNYIFIPGDNQKRAITLIHSSSSTPHFRKNLKDPNDAPSMHRQAPQSPQTSAESLTLPLLGSVAAGLPIESLKHDEYIDVPLTLVKNARKSFALKVQGESMIDEGIYSGDTIIVESRDSAENGQLIVAVVEGEATVKRIYLHQDQIELRPSNSAMESMWYSDQQVEIKGKVTSLLRTY